MSSADSFHILSIYPVLVSQSPPPTLFSCHSHLHLPCSRVTVTPTYPVLVSQLHQHTLFSCLPLTMFSCRQPICSRVLGTSMHLPCSRVVRLSLSRITVTSCTGPVLVSSAYPYLVSKSRQMHLPCSRHSVVRLSLFRVTVTSIHLPCSRVIYLYLVSQSLTLFSCRPPILTSSPSHVLHLPCSRVHTGYSRPRRSR